MSSPVEVLPDNSPATTLATAWVDFVGHEDVPPLGREWAHHPYVTASLDIAKLCTAACVDETFEPTTSRLWEGIETLAETTPPSHEYDDRAMNLSLNCGLMLIEGRDLDATTEQVRRFTYKRAVTIAANANFQIKETPASEVSTDLIRTRAAMTLLSLATLVPTPNKAVVGALPHQKYGAAPFSSYSITLLDRTSPDAAVTVRKVRFSCLDHEESDSHAGIVKSYAPGIVIVNACCQLERTTDTCAENISSLASRLARTRHHRATPEDRDVLHRAYEFLTETSLVSV